MIQRTKRVAAVHDLSGFGRSSMTTAVAVLAAMGHQPCPAPTAVFSTHTGIPGWQMTDLTGGLDAFFGHWQAIGLAFDGIYTGFLGSAEQTQIVRRMLETFRTPDNLIIVDPVMGDNGRRYTTCTPELCDGMRALVRLADVITPNLTEAALLLGEDETALPSDEEAIASWASRLRRMGARQVVITGLARGDALGILTSSHSGEALIVHPRAGGYFCGTGDLFASVLTGALLHGEGLDAAARRAGEFVALCVERTAPLKTPAMHGVCFERELYRLADAFARE